jgi:hypothetical protein
LGAGELGEGGPVSFGNQFKFYFRREDEFGLDNLKRHWKDFKIFDGGSFLLCVGEDAVSAMIIILTHLLNIKLIQVANLKSLILAMGGSKVISSPSSTSDILEFDYIVSEDENFGASVTSNKKKPKGRKKRGAKQFDLEDFVSKGLQNGWQGKQVKEEWIKQCLINGRVLTN